MLGGWGCRMRAVWAEAQELRSTSAASWAGRAAERDNKYVQSKLYTGQVPSLSDGVADLVERGMLDAGQSEEEWQMADGNATRYVVRAQARAQGPKSAPGANGAWG